MKSTIRVLALSAFIFVAAAPSYALPYNGAGYSGGTAYWTRVYNYYSGNGGEFTLKKDGPNTQFLLSNAAYSALTKGKDGPESFQTFCVETTEYVYDQPVNIWVSTAFIGGGQPGSHAWHGGAAPPGDDLDERTAYLYTKFATGTLQGYNYTPGPLRIASADALQKAIWYIENETGGENNSFVTLANGAVQQGGEWYGRGIGNVRVLQLWSPNDSGQRQDMLYLIPAPAAVMLGAVGLGLVGWVKRRLA